MRRFTCLYLELDQTTATAEKIDRLERYFRETPPADAAWALALFLGRRPKGAPSSRALRALVEEETGLSAWLISECHQAVGDFSETLALLLPRQTEGSDEPLHFTMEERVLPLAGADDASRRRIIAEAWRDFDTDQRFVYHKILRGSFRVGVQRRTVARALARIADVEPAAMAQRLAGDIRPTAAVYEAIVGEAGAHDEAAGPYPFFLAQQLDDPVETLGEPARWRAEWKWDGVRAQLIVRAGQVVLWSRGDELITEQFPEIAQAATDLPGGTVLDGEVLIWRGDRPLPFSELQKRLGRKVAPPAQPGLFEEDRAAFMAFDVMEAGGEDVRAQAFDERRALLEQLVENAGDDVIRLSPLIHADSWEALEALREESRERGVEGIMLKRGESPYGVGRTRPGGVDAWWKWKVAPHTVDAVLVYAQPGSGRRAGLLTDYTFAVWDRQASSEGELTTFTKAYSGLSNKEIEELDAWIRRHTLDRMGPIRHVEPEQVFEIAFEAIQESSRHKSGVAVRFPRILRWRRDKDPQQADTIEALRSLLKVQAR